MKGCVGNLSVVIIIPLPTEKFYKRGRELECRNSQRGSASLVDPTLTRGSCSCSATPFLTPEESNPVDRKMKERCFELTREWWPNDSSSHKLLDSNNL
ncbi:hypothetical protein TNCV_1748321 [Trichonephila clavipes]|nr:hypothetical protein TNCV_1748321 [Trichonephila clavipes]